MLLTTTTLQPFNGLFSRTTWVSRYQKGKTNLDFTGTRDSEWQWHQLASDRQPHQHPTTLFFTGRMPFLPPNQQRQSTEGTMLLTVILIIISFPSPTHSFTPGLKPSFSANPSHCSLSFSSSGLTT